MGRGLAVDGYYDEYCIDAALGCCLRPVVPVPCCCVAPSFLYYSHSRVLILVFSFLSTFFSPHSSLHILLSTFFSPHSSLHIFLPRGTSLYALFHAPLFQRHFSNVTLPTPFFVIHLPTRLLASRYSRTPFLRHSSCIPLFSI